MGEVSIIGIDLAKHVFQLHGAAADGRVVFRRRVRREKLLAFFDAQPACDVVMEACRRALLGAEIGGLGHRVRLVAPAYVKPFVKRQKNDAADAEAIVEAAQRPTMRFVAVKSAERQASATVFEDAGSAGSAADEPDECVARASGGVRSGCSEGHLPCRPARGGAR